MEKNQIVIIVISFLVGIVLGYIIAIPTIGNFSFNQESKIVAELREKGFLPPAPDSIDNIQGRVKEISDNMLVLVLEQNNYDPLDEFLPKEFTIQIDENTIFSKIREKSWEVYEQEQIEYDALMLTIESEGEGTLPVVNPPDFFITEEISLSEIEIDNLIGASFEQDIIGKKQGLATSISLYETIQTEEPNPEEIIE